VLDMVVADQAEDSALREDCDFVVKEPSRKRKTTRDVTRSPWMICVTSPVAMGVPSIVLRTRKPCARSPGDGVLGSPPHTGERR
jgi:hypothetical protein